MAVRSNPGLVEPRWFNPKTSPNLETHLSRPKAAPQPRNPQQKDQLQKKGGDITEILIFLLALVGIKIAEYIYRHSDPGAGCLANHRDV